MICTLQTSRLTLRPFASSDLTALEALFQEESIWWYPLRRAMTPSETSQFLRRRLAENEIVDAPSLHAVVERASGNLAGYVGLCVPHFLPEVLPAIEVGWRLGESFRGKGFAVEAAREALRWGFEDLQLSRVLSIFEPENTASGRVMERLGFQSFSHTVDPHFGFSLEVRELSVSAWRLERSS